MKDSKENNSKSSFNKVIGRRAYGKCNRNQPLRWLEMKKAKNPPLSDLKTFEFNATRVQAGATS